MGSPSPPPTEAPQSFSEVLDQSEPLTYPDIERRSGMLRYLISDQAVVFVILLNALSLALWGYERLHPHFTSVLFFIDYFCTCFFIIEMGLKIKLIGWQRFWSSSWNRFDLLVVAFSSPMLLAPWLPLKNFGVFLVLRMARTIRVLKVASLIPDSVLLWNGMQRALSASLGLLVALVIYLFTLAVIAHALFGEIDPDHFGNTLESMYTMFRIFTLDGWAEIPEAIAQEGSSFLGIVAKLFFVFTVLSGGILGVSLANAVFVDEMVMDNNQDLEHHLDHRLDALLAEQQALREMVQALHQDRSTPSDSPS